MLPSVYTRRKKTVRDKQPETMYFLSGKNIETQEVGFVSAAFGDQSRRQLSVYIQTFIGV